MKLAEALNLRADTAKRLSQLSERLAANAKVQEGDSPAEDPSELLEELDRLTKQLEDLISRINLTNSKTLYEGKTLTEMIAAKDTLSLKSSILRNFLSASSAKIDRYSNKEIRVVSTVNVRELQKSSDEISEEIRKLNVKIQELNWSADLL
ncbi:MAG: DIP1984 family protein [Oscillospiraceae bacterium]|nr:DIP1984 family protein [Oscillospiraceae bacterium]